MIDVLTESGFPAGTGLRDIFHLQRHRAVGTGLVILRKFHGMALACQLYRVAIRNFRVPLGNLKIYKLVSVKEKLDAHRLPVQIQIGFDQINTLLNIHRYLLIPKSLVSRTVCIVAWCEVN